MPTRRFYDYLTHLGHASRFDVARIRDSYHFWLHALFSIRYTVVSPLETIAANQRSQWNQCVSLREERPAE